MSNLILNPKSVMERYVPLKEVTCKLPQLPLEWVGTCRRLVDDYSDNERITLLVDDTDKHPVFGVMCVALQAFAPRRPPVSQDSLVYNAARTVSVLSATFRATNEYLRLRYRNVSDEDVAKVLSAFTGDNVIITDYVVK